MTYKPNMSNLKIKSLNTLTDNVAPTTIVQNSLLMYKICLKKTVHILS